MSFNLFDWRIKNTARRVSNSKLLLSAMARKQCFFSLMFIPAFKHCQAEIKAAVTTDDGSVRATFFNGMEEPVVLPRGSRVAHVRLADATNSIFSVETETPPSSNDIQVLYDKLNIDKKGLSAAQDKRVRIMLSQCYYAFSHKGEVGKAKISPIHIQFANSHPIRCKPYRHTEADNKVIRQLIDDMLAQGLVAKADGRFASPLCLIWQKNKPRAVVDYRAVNRQILPNQKGTIPPLQEQLKKVKPNSIMSIFDLTKAFMNFRITEETSQMSCP